MIHFNAEHFDSSLLIKDSDLIEVFFFIFLVVSNFMDLAAVLDIMTDTLSMLDILQYLRITIVSYWFWCFGYWF